MPIWVWLRAPIQLPWAFRATRPLVLYSPTTAPSTATNVVLLDALPSSFSVISAQSTLGASQVLGNNISCNVGTLAAGSSGILTVVAKANLYGSFTNSADVTSIVLDLVNSNNLARAAVTVIDIANSPTLTITPIGSQVLLSWSTNATAQGFVLHSKTSLAANIPWAPVPTLQ